MKSSIEQAGWHVRQLEEEQRIDAALKLMQREIDNLRAEVKDLRTLVWQSRPPADALIRRQDVLATELLRLGGKNA